MEEVLEKFENLCDQADGDKSKTSFDGLYKNWGRLGNQEERRKEILQVQKSNRTNKLDRFRGILELVNAVEEESVWENSKKVYYRPSIYVAGFNKASPTYKNVLMLSEWMIEKPEDFSENWHITPCPKGVRMLVVASGGHTKFYTKHGQFRFDSPTALPGGNGAGRTRNQCCVLDGFYQEKINTMFVLDLLAWNSQPMTDCEAEFRNFWLTTKFEELPELQAISRINKIIFKVLPKVSCELNSLNEFMMSYPPFNLNCPTLDGLLFYHKRAHYVCGETPLVGWLFPYMVPELLGPEVTVHQSYLSSKPAGYVNQADFIIKFEEKHAKKTRTGSRRNSTSSNSNMDTAEAKHEKIKTTTKEKKNSAMDAEEAATTTEKPPEKPTENMEEKKNSAMDAEEAVTETEKAPEKPTENMEEKKNSAMDAEEAVTETEKAPEKPTENMEEKKNSAMDAEEAVTEAETPPEKPIGDMEDCKQ